MKTKKLMNRRTILRGAGASIALPPLEAMMTSKGLFQSGANAQPSPYPVSLLTFLFPCGVTLSLDGKAFDSSFFPSQTGTQWDLPTKLASFAPVKEYVNVLYGLDKTERDVNKSLVGEAHARSQPTFATGTGLSDNPGNGAGGPSIDYYAAQRLGQNTPLNVLPVALGPDFDAMGHCNATWSGIDTPVPAERNPQALFSLITGSAPEGGVPLPSQPDVVNPRRRAVLDFVLGDIHRLKGRLGSNDKSRLDEHLTSIEELERRLDVTQEMPTSMTCALPEAVTDAHNSINDLSNEKARLLIDLQIKAFECGITHFGSFQLVHSAANRRFSWLGIDGGHHNVSHENRAGLDRIAIDQLEQISYLLQKMKAVPIGDKDLLHHSIVFATSEIAQGNGGDHSIRNMPVLLCGRAGGKMVGGHSIHYPTGSRYADTFVSILNLLGIEESTFGTHGKAPLSGLTA